MNKAKQPGIYPGELMIVGGLTKQALEQRLMNNPKQTEFYKLSQIKYNSLPFSGEREDCTDYSHKKKWGTLGKAFIRELAEAVGAIAICPQHNWSGDIDRGQINAFLTNQARDKFVYINISDSGLTPAILYRTAKHEKDYGGGSNNFCSIEDTAKMKAFIIKHLNN